MIDQLAQEMALQSANQAEHFQDGTVDLPIDAAANEGFPYIDPLFSPHSLLGSPESLMASSFSMNDSPLLPDYDIPADMAATFDNNPIAFPERLDFQVDIPLEWDEPANWATSGLLNYTDPTAPWNGCSLEANSASQMQYPQTYTQNFDPAAFLPPQPTLTRVFAQSPAQQPSPTTTNSDLACTHCGHIASDKTKLKIHTNKHTKPFRCTAADCTYATAENKSLQRHLVARSRFDESHRQVAEALLGGSDGAIKLGKKYACTGVGCTYATVREDNLKRHAAKCSFAREER